MTNEELILFIKKVFLKSMSLWGKSSRLHLEKGAEVNNTLFNVSSGHIYVGKNTIFGHNCMVITGRHLFEEGKRASLIKKIEVPKEGYDIHIGEGCWICSGSIISGGVTIGNNVVIGAGAVVVKDIPDNVFAAGNPAKIIKKI